MAVMLWIYLLTLCKEGTGRGNFEGVSGCVVLVKMDYWLFVSLSIFTIFVYEL